MLRPLRIGISAKGAFFSFSSMTGNFTSLSALSAKTSGPVYDKSGERRSACSCLYYPSQSVNASGSVSVVCRQRKGVSSDDNRQQLSAILSSSNQTSSICALAG